MINSMHNTQVATAASCSRLVGGVELGYAMGLNGRNRAISGAAITGGFWAFDPKTTKHHHSQRERRT